MEKIKEYGRAGNYTFSLMVWDDDDQSARRGSLITGDQVLDIRLWKDGEPKNGVCLTPSMAATLLLCGVQLGESEVKEPVHSGKFGKIEFFLYNIYATLGRESGRKVCFTRCAFKDPTHAKYDIRTWDGAMKQFTPGVSFSYADLMEALLLVSDYTDDQHFFIPPLDFAKANREKANDLVRELLVMWDYAYLAMDDKAVDELKRGIFMLIKNLETKEGQHVKT